MGRVVVSKSQESQHSVTHKRKRIAQTRANIVTLTPREKQVLACVVEGFANKQIATRLRMSIRTVEVHRARIMRKMKAQTPISLACEVQCANCELFNKMAG